MAEVNHGEGGVGSSSFIQYSIALQQRSSLKSQIESQMAHVTLLEQLVTIVAVSLADPEGSKPLRAVRSEASIARSRAEQMVGHVYQHPQTAMFIHSHKETRSLLTGKHER